MNVKAVWTTIKIHLHPDSAAARLDFYAVHRCRGPHARTLLITLPGDRYRGSDALFAVRLSPPPREPATSRTSIARFIGIKSPLHIALSHTHAAVSLSVSISAQLSKCTHVPICRYICIIIICKCVYRDRYIYIVYAQPATVCHC